MNKDAKQESYSMTQNHGQVLGHHRKVSLFFSLEGGEGRKREDLKFLQAQEQQTGREIRAKFQFSCIMLSLHSFSLFSSKIS